jgi:hypothetical protein
MEDIHFLDPLSWNFADVDEFPAYPPGIPQIFYKFPAYGLPPWNFHRFLMNFYSSLGNSTDGF